MSKFHISLKVRGLELEVEGTREDVPVMREALAHQFTALLQPATEIAEGETSRSLPLGASTPAAIAETAKRGRRRGRAASIAGGQAGPETAVVWRHDTTKYGSPQQAWSNADKAIWTLYVAAAESSTSEMSNVLIVKTFARQFRQAGPIRGNNLARDLNRFKTAQNGNPPLVSEDATKNPSAWFLTEAGNRHAQRLIAQALGQPTA